MKKMMNSKFIFSCIFVAAVAISSTSRAAAPVSATDIVRKAESEVIARIKSGRDVSDVLESLIDYEKIARDSLGVNWIGASVDQRSEFLFLFKSLVKKSYQRNLKHVGSYHTEWKGEETHLTDAFVYTEVVKNDGREEPLKVVYRLEASRVVDIITEDSSMVDRYKSQFRRIILKSNFDGLLKKMRDKSVKD